MGFKSLEDSLKEVLKDDNKVSKYEAKVLREVILSDGHVSKEEKTIMEKALKENNFDEEAFAILSDLILRAELS